MGTIFMSILKILQSCKELTFVIMPSNVNYIP